MTVEERIEKLLTVEVSNLPKLISEIVGYDVTIQIFDVTKRGYLGFCTNSLIEHTGIMKPFYEDFRIRSFNCGFVTGENNEELYWVGLSFSFQYKTGGSNGTSLKNIYYDFSSKNWFVSKYN